MQDKTEAEACADATLEYAKQQAEAGTAATLTYRDGVRDALCGMLDYRAKGVNIADLPPEYRDGRNTAAEVKNDATNYEHPPRIREYWAGFLAALRFDWLNDRDPTDDYAWGARDGQYARERVEAGGRIGGFTDDEGHQYSRFRIRLTGSRFGSSPRGGTVRTLGPYARRAEALADARTMREAGWDLVCEGRTSPKPHKWVEIDDDE